MISTGTVNASLDELQRLRAQRLEEKREAAAAAAGQPLSSAGALGNQRSQLSPGGRNTVDGRGAFLNRTLDFRSRVIPQAQFPTQTITQRVVYLGHVAPNLTSLSLRGNCLTSLKGLERQDAIETLDVRDNKLASAGNTVAIVSMKALKLFKVAGNPLCIGEKPYRDEVWSKTGKMVEIDGVSPEPGQLSSTLSVTR